MVGSYIVYCGDIEFKQERVFVLVYKNAAAKPGIPWAIPISEQFVAEAWNQVKERFPGVVLKGPEARTELACLLSTGSGQW